MKNLIWLVGMAVVASCASKENLSEFTGNEVTYPLLQASQYDVSGTVVIKEKRDGSAVVAIEVAGTSGDAKYPAHLHLGDLSTQGADVAALLKPIVGSIGKSETSVTQLADETVVSYTDFVKLNACIKIHLSDVGPEKDIILAAGNIGAASSIPGGRVGIAACKSN
jgi:hypothetical protein